MAEKIPGSPHPRPRGARRRPSDPAGSGGIDRRPRTSLPPGMYEGRHGSVTLRRALAAAAALGWASTGGAPAGLAAAASAERPAPSPRLDCPDPADGPPPEGDGEGGRKGLFIVGFSALVSILLFVMGGDEEAAADVEDDKNDPPIRL